MNSGMYSALSSSEATMQRMEIISNNLANVNTPGFKKDKIAFECLLNGPVNPPAVPNSTTADPILQQVNVQIDYSPGPVTQTGNKLDVYLGNDGFFVVNTPNGPAYTRQGNFHLAGDGTLVTVDGFPVMGQGGEIRIKGSKVEIDTKGAVIVDGSPAGTISVVDFPKPYNLTKVTGASFIPATPQTIPQPVDADILQGHLEGSNVETISEMVQMIAASRYFDASSKVIKAYDDMASKAVNELGRL